MASLRHDDPQAALMAFRTLAQILCIMPVLQRRSVARRHPAGSELRSPQQLWQLGEVRRRAAGLGRSGHPSMIFVQVDVAVLLRRQIFGLRFRGHNGLAILTYDGPQLPKPALLPN
jgi:hypothetical protein